MMIENLTLQILRPFPKHVPSLYTMIAILVIKLDEIKTKSKSSPNNTIQMMTRKYLCNYSNNTYPSGKMQCHGKSSLYSSE